MAKFIISTDSCVDLYKSVLEKQNIYYIMLKRVVNGKESAEMYDSEAEFDRFYEEIKKGALPTTTQLNSFELQEYFEGILKAEPSGDIIHIPLSSGLSGTCDNAKATADAINKTLSGRKIYVLDSLIATVGMSYLVELAIELRNAGVETDAAVRRLEQARDRLQGWVVVDNLFHLKRGGRISGFKAALGTLLNMKPVIVLSKMGRLAIENTMKGHRKAIKYILSSVEKYGVSVLPDFFSRPVYLGRSSKSEFYDEFKRSFVEKFPQATIKEGIVGPIIGTHLGDGCIIALFEGGPRLDI
ncbi:MAG: DegV family protein [Firmicutes bacterium]|nr:DegV family protein [Bacillota bacterium]